MEFKKVLQKPLVAVRIPLNWLDSDAQPDCIAAPTIFAPPQAEDMPPEMGAEATEIITSAIDKYIVTGNYEVSPTTAISCPLKTPVTRTLMRHAEGGTRHKRSAG
jgi:hypothetical protein